MTAFGARLPRVTASYSLLSLRANVPPRENRLTLPLAQGIVQGGQRSSAASRWDGWALRSR
jgi:hypothetical protein